MEALVEETIKPAVDFLKAIKNKKVAIVHGHDNDSICSAVIIYKLLENHHKIEAKFIVSDLNFAISENVVNEVKKYRPDFIIAVDLAEIHVNILTQLRNLSKVLIIDHHKPKGYVKVTYVNPRILDKNIYLPATYLCYKTYGKFLNTKEILWIAGIGTLSDMGLKYCSDLFEDIKRNNNELVGNNRNVDEDLFDNSVLGKLAKVFDSARVVNGVKGAVTALNSLVRMKDYNEVLKDGQLIGWFEIVDKEFNRLVKDFEKKKGKGRLILYEIKSKYNIKSPLAGYLSKFLQREILVVYQKSEKHVDVSFRRGKLSLADLNELAEKSVKDIPDSSGGGHPAASGARLPIKYLSKFLTNIKRIK